MGASSDQSATGSPPPRRPQAPPGAVPDPVLFPVTFHLHKLKAAGDELADVLYWARAGFAAVAVICEALTDLRPVEYLEPLASARDAAAQAADLLDQVSATPPPPPLRPGQPIPVPALGGGPELLVPPTPGSPAVKALAARTQRIADGSWSWLPRSG